MKMSVSFIKRFGLCLCLFLLLLPICASGEDSSYNKIQYAVAIEAPEIEGLYFVIEDGKATLIEYTGDTWRLTIPEKINGYPVTSIHNNAFQFCKTLRSVTIPGSVTSIGNDAFYGCTKLESITIPDSVTSIGEYAFKDCCFTSITLPDSITSIGSAAFNDCTKLESINIPKGVSSIEGSTFWECTSLKSVTIPEGVTSIGRNAFYNCKSLISIRLPESVTYIEGRPFDKELYIFVKEYSSAHYWCLNNGYSKTTEIY